MSTVALRSHAVEPQRHALPARPAPACARADVRPHERGAALLTIAGLHLAAVWALTSLHGPPAPTPVVAALQIDFVTPTPLAATPAPPAAAPTPPRQTPPPRRPRPVPVVAAPVATEDAAPFTAAPAPEMPPPVPQPAVPTPAAAAAPAPMAPPAPPSPTPTPAPRVLPASAVAYLVPPPIEVPLASRRLGEAGTVWLRVRVGRDGLPQQIVLQRSSGYERLDRQALDAMQRARFRPQIEDGTPIEWVVVAPLQYDLH